MPMSDPRELEWAKKPDALKESWKARNRTHIVHGVPLTVSHFERGRVMWEEETSPPSRASSEGGW
jgi:hypothetical protein